MIRKERNSFSEIPCIVCDCIIKQDINEFWEGIVSQIDGGFASDFDFDVINIGLCNTCTKKKLDEGKIYYSHNMMDYFNGYSLITDETNEVIDTPSKWDDILKSKLRDQKINDIIDEKDD